ncbi:MAG: putative signaling protein [Anaerolineaceae bacterium]|nr:MAG: putative signaling protein [Anaerolineaceae bacterium]
MSGESRLISGALYLTALLSVYIAGIAFRRRRSPGALALCLLMCATAEWTLCVGLEIGSAGVSQKILFSKMGSLGFAGAPTLLLIFALAYTQQFHWLTFRSIGLLSIVPVAAMLLAATNEWHHWIWVYSFHRPSLPYLIFFEYGPVHYALMLYNFLLVLAGLLVMGKAWLHGAPYNRIRIGIILAAILFPSLASILHIAGLDLVPGLDLTPVSFSITGAFIAFGIFRTKIFNVIPIARENLIENMRDGVLVCDAQNHVVDINSAAQKAIGISAREIIGQPASRLPADWEAAVCQIEDAPSARKEIRLDSDPPLYLDLQTTPLFDRRHRLRGRMIVFRDVTERRQAETQLALRAEELDLLNRISLAITSGLEVDSVLKTLHEQCNTIIHSDVFYVALYDDATGIVQMSLYYEKGYQTHPPFDLHNRPGLTGHIIESRQTLYLPDVAEPDASLSSTPVRVGGTMSRSYIGIPLILREKVIGVMSVQSYKPAFYTDNQVRLLEMVAVEAAIAIENARLYGEVQRLAIIDELTGVYNYRGLTELGKREVERARRFNHPFSLLFFDIDGFRNFNNIYSHATGNLVLKAITERAHSALRAVDIFTRYGGDEFVVLLPETNREMALQAAKRLVAEIASTQVATDHGELSVTISVGVTTLTEEIPDISALIDRANRAEHRAKKKGNCVKIEE